MSSELSEAMAAMIAERKQVRETAYATQRQAIQSDREMFERRRTYGLRQRHARKLARIAEQGKLA